MSARALAWAWRQQPRTTVQKLVLAALADRADDDGECYPSVEWLAQKCAPMTPRTLRRNLADLAEQGFVTKVERRRRGDGTLGTWLYRLPLDAEPAATSGQWSPAATDGRAEVGPLTGDLEEPDGSSDGPPKLVKVDGRDQAFDALATECVVDPNGNRAREVAYALNGSKQKGLPVGIRELAWRELPEPLTGPAFEGWLVACIEKRARQYRERMSGAMLTPLALAKWWTDLADAPTQPHTKFGRRDVSAGEMLEAARRLEEGDERKEIERATG